MVKVKAKRKWICPLCEGAVMGLERPRRDDVRRYCLPCSEKGGRLVERTCPALEREREKKAEKRKETRQARKGRVRKVSKRRRANRRKAKPSPLESNGRRVRVEDVDMHALAEALLGLEAWGGFFQGNVPTLEARQSAVKRESTGRAYRHLNRIVITFPSPSHATLGEATMVLIHELAHLAVEPSLHNGRRSCHGRRWKAAFARAVKEVFGFKSSMLGRGKGSVWDRELKDAQKADKRPERVHALLERSS